MTNKTSSTTRKFKLGSLMMTGGVNDKVAENSDFAKFVQDSLVRHMKCDWGEMTQDDKNENDLAVKTGNLRIFSSYEMSGMAKIWIITEADRSVTTVLFPEEY